LEKNAAKSIYLWRRGCLALAGSDLAAAEEFLNESISLSPDSAISQAALVIVSSARRKRLDAEKELIPLYTRWANDARLPVLLGSISAAWSNYDDAREALAGVAARMSDDEAKTLIGNLFAGDSRGFDELKKTFGKE